MAKNNKNMPAQTPPEASDAPALVRVTVMSKHLRFVDLITGAEITRTPIEVELHPWLQAQIDAGLLIEC